MMREQQTFLPFLVALASSLHAYSPPDHAWAAWEVVTLLFINQATWSKWSLKVISLEGSALQN
jgi:hypothetical protein